MQTTQVIDLERERTVGEILMVTLKLYWRFPLLFAVLALGVIAPYELLSLVVTGVGPLGTKSGNAGTSLLFDLLNLSLVGPLISALHIHAVVEIGKGRQPKLGAVALMGLRVLPVVAAAEIVANFLIALGLLAFIIPGVLLALGWSVVAQTAAIDHGGWLPALGRSRKLTAGSYGHIFGLLLIVNVATIAIGLLAQLLFKYVGTGGSATGVDWILLGIAVHTITASLMALSLAILYFDLRAHELLSRESPAEYQHLRDLD